MGILQFPKQLTGTVGILPNLRYMISSDSLSKITSPGYLNDTNRIDATPLSNNDVILALYSYNTRTTSGTFGIFTVSLTSANGITLSAWVDSGNVLLPVTNGDFAIFNGSNGQIKDDGYAPSATNPFVVMSPGGLIANHVPYFSDVNGTLADSGIAYTNLMTLNGTNTMTPSASIIAGKANATEAGNTVTANGFAGKITTSFLTVTGGGSYIIAWTNSFITASSVVLITVAGGSNTVQNISVSCIPSLGGALLNIFNNTASTPLNGSIIISYLVM